MSIAFVPVHCSCSRLSSVGSCHAITPDAYGLLVRDWLCLFVAMLNLLRIRNGYSVRGLRMFCISANVVMTVFVAALMASIGGARTGKSASDRDSRIART